MMLSIIGHDAEHHPLARFGTVCSIAVPRAAVTLVLRYPRVAVHRALSSLFALSVLAVGCARTQVPRGDLPSIESLAWLGGAWRSTDGPSTTVERWNLARDGAMRGASTTLRDGALVHHELLRLDARGGRVRYVAAPEGQAVTEFALVSARANFARFENPAHDYPQWIEYRRDGDRLTARIGANDAARPRISEWTFERESAAGESSPLTVTVCADAERAQEINVTVPRCTCGANVLCREMPSSHEPLALAVFDRDCDACMESSGRCVAPQMAARVAAADGGCVQEVLRNVR